MSIYWEDASKIQELFLGKSVISAIDGELVLSDGTHLTIEPNNGECSCGGGDYSLDRLNTFPNIITSVDVLCSEGFYQLFVYSEGIGESIADISGDDGSGYYGTGFSIAVQKPTQQEVAR